MSEWFGLQTLVQLGIAAGVIAIVWQFLRPQYAVVIRIRQGKIAVAKGKLRRQFLDDLTDMVAKEQLTRGTITARQNKQRISLSFSREFSAGLQQQIRNAWHAAT